MANPERVEEIVRVLDSLPEQDQRAVLAHLRRRYPVHPLELQWGVPAEVILEAIARSPDLSQRGVRGLIAEAYLETHVLPGLQNWQDITQPGNHAFDFELRGPGAATARIQVKSQRKKNGRPMMANEGYRYLSSEMFVVETQRTRGGRDSSGADTRPYRFGDFDILAVNMEPSTGRWTDFRYTLERWLLPRDDDPGLILKFQPVARDVNSDWTDDLGICLDWFMGGEQKRIAR